MPVARIWSLQRPARLYLIHMALLTFGLAISSLFFNLAIPALGYDLPFLGLLTSLPVVVAGLLTLPLWWLITRTMRLRMALLASALLYAGSVLAVALWPAALPLLLGTALTGPAAVLLQVSKAPFMMRHSRSTERDFLFSVSEGINIGVAGLGSLVGGLLPGLCARLLDVPADSGVAYRATFALAALCVLAAAVPLLFVRDERTYDESEATNADSPALRDHANDAAAERHDHTAAAAPLHRRVVAFAQRSAFTLTGRVPEPWRSMVRRPWSVARFMVTPLIISCGAALLIPYLNLFFRERFGVSNEALGGIFAAVHIATGMATLAAPWLSLRLGKMGSVALTQALAVPCLLALGMSPVLGIAIGFALVRNTLMNMASPLYDAHAMEQSSAAARPTVIGLINGAYAIGYIFGPNISVRVQAAYGFTPLFVATAIFYAVAALLNYMLFVHGRRHVREPASEAEFSIAQE